MDIKIITNKSRKRDRDFVKEQGIAWILDMMRTHRELVQESHDRDYAWLSALHSRLLKKNKGKAYVWVMETHTGLYKLQGDSKGATLTVGERKHMGGEIKLVRSRLVE